MGCLTINKCLYCVKLDVATVLIMPLDFYWLCYAWGSTLRIVYGNDNQDRGLEAHQIILMVMTVANWCLRVACLSSLIYGFARRKSRYIGFWVYSKIYLVLWDVGYLIYCAFFFVPEGHRGYFWSKVNPDEPLVGMFMTDFFIPIAAYVHFILVVNSHRRNVLEENRKQNRSAGELLDDVETFQYEK